MKKLSTLLIALQFIAVNLFADTEPIYQWNSPNGQVSQLGGSITYYDGDNGLKINYPDAENVTGSTFYTILVDGQESHQSDEVKTTASGRLVIKLVSPLQEGDELSITGYQNNTLAEGRSSLKIMMGDDVFSEGEELAGFWPNISASADADMSPSSYQWTINDEWAGQTQITLTLAEGEAPIYITDITINREYEYHDMSKLIMCSPGYLNSFSFPYTVTCDDDAQFYYFDGVKNGFVYGIPVAKGSELQAGVPYLYIPAEGVECITVNCTDEKETYVTPKHYNGIYAYYNRANTTMVISGSEYEILTTKGLQYCSDQGNKVKQNSCYFKSGEIVRTYTTSAKSVCLSSAASFLDDDAMTTDINTVNVAKANQSAIYNLSGQRVSNPRQGGIYIINGKKVIMK